IVEDSPLFDRRISHDWNMTLAAPRKQIVFGATPRQVIQHLVGRDALASIQGNKLLHIRDVKIADAPVTDLAGLDKRFERRNRLFQRYRTAPMQQIKVEMICL